ncbi:hypothetical protein GPECTOR_376g170 [Gonium pectorale]|uniref:Uncharacterized protein n=1 Tax=Gonium pectorale TaxID=33097 RepID=A0A150FVE4_GONPE|nr:hypothetical protein GPECTOR_376g170 [Gonium pectorale]|eukprot:KXZ41593.1 hypothetical protein GPECTOR_376g170 [Gonium pectorale]
MPGRSVLRRDGVDEFFRKEIETYRKAVDTVRGERRLNDDRAWAEKLLLDVLKKPNPECEALMSRAHALEDDGKLPEAAALYARVLSCADQADNHELRTHLAELNARINRREANARARARQAELAADMEEQRWRRVKEAGGQARPRTAAPRVSVNWGPEPGVPKANKPVGPAMPMAPDAYRAELAAQVGPARVAGVPRVAEAEGAK